MRCEEVFYKIYGREPAGIRFCPYRICPVGAHIDHQLGKVTGFALDRGIHMAYGPERSGIVEVCSLNFPNRAQWHIRAVPEECAHDWADYLRGATWALSKRYPLQAGICGVIEGSLPIGGLSSSAAVIITFLTALCEVNHIRLSQQELIMTALDAENRYVGVSCGKLDQSCEVYSRKNHLLYLDTKDDSFELIPQHPDMKPYKIGIFFSGIERTLVGSPYNMRVDECRSAACSLKAYAGMPCGKLVDTYLRDVPYEVYLQYKDRLPETFAKRTEHYYREFARVEKGVEAWRRGDLDTYGRMCFESGRSSIENWETGSPELKALFEIMTVTDGIYGGRFSGAGFRGCCMALIDPAYEESVLKQVGAAYRKAFPHLEGKFSAHICESAEGVIL